MAFKSTKRTVPSSKSSDTSEFMRAGLSKSLNDSESMRTDLSTVASSSDCEGIFSSFFICLWVGNIFRNHSSIIDANLYHKLMLIHILTSNFKNTHGFTSLSVGNTLGIASTFKQIRLFLITKSSDLKCKLHTIVK